MFHFQRFSRFLGLVAFCSLISGLHAKAEQPILTIRAEGTLVIDENGFGLSRLSGTAPAMGKFACYSELVFTPSEQEDSLEGIGFAVFTAANGDLIAALVEWQISADGTNDALVHWRNEVTFSDGRNVATTGRFVNKRPPGPIYIKIDGRVGSTNAI